MLVKARRYYSILHHICFCQKEMFFDVDIVLVRCVSVWMLHANSISWLPALYFTGFEEVSLQDATI